LSKINLCRFAAYLNKINAPDTLARTGDFGVISQPRSTFVLKVLSLIIATLITGAVTIIIYFLSSEHMCSRQSIFIEWPLFILTFSLSCFWTAKAKLMVKLGAALVGQLLLLLYYTLLIKVGCIPTISQKVYFQRRL